MNYTISLYLDTRRALKNGLFPVKIRVYSSHLKKAKLFPTKYEYSEKGFASVWLTEKPRIKYQEQRLELHAILTKANEQAKNIKPFSFELFAKKLYLKAGEGQNVFHHYSQLIEKNLNSGSLGNADIYRLSMSSIKAFLKETTGKKPTILKFSEITPDWLKRYENYQLKERDKIRSRTTVSMYIRSLRAVFNKAIQENEILPEQYPFGKKGYKIPNVRNVKKALTKEQLKRLFEVEPQTTEQKKAKDFWFFSYACNGINMKDVAFLRYENLQQDTLVFYRAKTINTTDEIKPVIVYLNDFTLSIIEKYGNPDKGKKQFIFSIVNDTQTEAEKQRAVKVFTRFVNQHIKKLAASIELPEDISTYWARHSFATNAIQSGASMEFVSEALNHTDMKTTKKYFAGFDNDTKKEIAKLIMQFD